MAQIVGFYDIVGLQEALPHQVQDVADRLPWMSHVGQGATRMAGEKRVLFYNHDKWELLHHETLWLSSDWKTPGAVGWSADLPRIVTVAWFHQVETGRRVRVYNTHWSHVSAEARKGMRLIASLDAIHEADATAVLGDFNEEADAPGAERCRMPVLWTPTMRFARCRKTFLPTRPSRRRIFRRAQNRCDLRERPQDRVDLRGRDHQEGRFHQRSPPVHAVSWASVRE